MKKTELFKLSLKELTFRQCIVPVLGFAIAAFCLLFASNTYFEVQNQKDQPCELIVSGKQLNDLAVTEILKIDIVLDVSPVQDVSAKVKFGEYAADLTLTGIKENYIETVSFPKNAVMPYIIINSEAVKLFKIPEDKAVDFNNLTVEIQIGEKTVTGKIFGLLKDKLKTPKAYISLPMAKELTDSSYTNILVRVLNIGCSEEVSTQISKLNLTVENTNTERQTLWDGMDKETLYLLIIGLFSILCSIVVLSAYTKVGYISKSEQYDTLMILGFKHADVVALSAFRNIIQVLMGLAVGVCIALVLPDFMEDKASVFALSIVPDSVLFVFIVYVVAGFVVWVNADRSYVIES